MNKTSTKARPATDCKIEYSTCGVLWGLLLFGMVWYCPSLVLEDQVVLTGRGSQDIAVVDGRFRVSVLQYTIYLFGAFLCLLVLLYISLAISSEMAKNMG